jgi:hypothetical protein
LEGSALLASGLYSKFRLRLFRSSTRDILLKVLSQANPHYLISIGNVALCNKNAKSKLKEGLNTVFDIAFQMKDRLRHLITLSPQLPISLSPHLLIQGVSSCPPTTSSGILRVGWASPTGTPWPSFPQVPIPNPRSLPTISMSFRT